MFVSNGANEIHHIKVSTVRISLDKDGQQYAVIVGKGQLLRRTPTTSSGFTPNTYTLKILVKGFLVGYVEAEIDEGDSICVVGYSTDMTRKIKDNVYKDRVCRAECIYKEDFLKYFPMRNNFLPTHLAILE